MQSTSFSDPADPGLAYRERKAWLALAAQAVAYLPLFAALALGRPSFGSPLPTFLILLTIASAVRIAVLVVGARALRRAWPDDAAQPPDERDRQIEQRGMTVGYIFLLAGMIVVGMVLPFYRGGLELVRIALVALVVADASTYATVVHGYRRR